MKKLFSFIAVFLSLSAINNVSALENTDEYYTNQKGVIMSKEDYEYLVDATSWELVDFLSQDHYDLLMEDISNCKKIFSETKYIMTSTFKGANGRIINYEQEITEEEYNNFEPIMPMDLCSEGVVCWETNAKQYYMLAYQFDSEYEIFGVLKWKTIPQISSYDINAIRWESSGGTFVATSYGAAEHRDTERYFTPESQRKKLSNGYGTSVLIRSGNEFRPINIISVSGYFTGATTTKFYGTYQHATKPLTLAQSMSYTLNANGLGGSVYFSDANLRSSYDNMTGVY